MSGARLSLAAPGLLPAIRRVRLVNPLWLAVPGLLFLALFFLYPVARLLLLSLQDADTGALSVASYSRLFSRNIYVRVLQNTFTIAAQTTGLCLLLAYPVAYWLTSMPARRRQSLLLLVLLPFWTSALVKAFAWIVLLARTGVVARLLADVTGSAEPVEMLYGRGAVLMGMVHALLPLAVMTMLPVMTQIDQQYLRAAQTLGAPRAQAFWRVFFQLSMPGVAAAGLLVFIASLGFFITPTLLGGPKDPMLGPLIITQIQTMLNWGFAGALAAMLIVTALVTCAVYDRVFGLSTVSGGTGRQREGRSWLATLGMAGLALVANLHGMLSERLARLLGGHRFNWIVPAIACTVVAFMVLPILVIFPMGFTSSRFLEFPPPGYSLEWMATYFGSEMWITATLRSFGVAFATALATTALAGLAALGVARGQGRGGGLIFGMFLAPMVVPHIVCAIALFYLFAQMSLVATDAGLIIGHTVMAMPVVFVTILAILKNYDWRLDQAAATLGASRSRALRRVTLPLIKGGLAAAFLFAFIWSFEELTVAIFIGGGLKTTLPKAMWDDMLLQVNPTLAAVSVVVVLIVVSLFAVAQRLRRE
ncbi:MAG: ABC transporter permease subunit [Acetobacteraceae bacterium]